MIYGFYKDRISADKLKKMRSYELKDSIRSLEDEVDKLLMIQDMTITAMSKYARALEDEVSRLNAMQTEVEAITETEEH